MRLDLTLTCPIRDSFRVQQVAGMFGLNVDEHCRETFSVEVPSLDEPWQIGAIVGPSGSGKTSIARAAFGSYLARRRRWPRDRAVIDCFGERSIREVTHALSAVGLSSPPAWIKPYHVLSTGERFRCDLARAFLERRQASGIRRQEGEHGASAPDAGYPLGGLKPDALVIDEFTSVIDRTTARFASAAVSRAIRSFKIGCRLIAVTCHRDILRWLEPDWALDMGTRELSRGRLRRPPIRLRLVRGTRDAWPLFARHHYLDAALPRGVTIYIGEILESEPEDGLPRPSNAEDRRDGRWQPAVFCAWGALFGRRDVFRIARLVVLPQYQGVGIGSRMLKACCELIGAQGRRATITTSHPAMIAHLAASPDWQVRDVKPLGGNRCGVPSANYRASTGRPVVSAEYVAPKGRDSTAQGATLGNGSSADHVAL